MKRGVAESTPISPGLAADAAFPAATTPTWGGGGLGYATVQDLERYWRHSRPMRIARASKEMIMNYLAEHISGLPRLH